MIKILTLVVTKTVDNLLKIKETRN